MAEFVTVGRGDEVAEGAAKAFSVGGQEIAVARAGGTLYAFSDICTHRACNLAMGGEIEGTTITCECHGSIFDMSDGSVVQGPATDPLATFGVSEDGGDLRIEA